MSLLYRVKLGYGLGHVLNDLCSAIWFTYLLIFFHHVLVFNNTLAGVILLIGQIADGLATPFIGHEADRTDDLAICAKYGRKKTWHLVGTLCVFFTFPFLFLGCLGCDSADDWAQVIYFTPFVVIFQFGWACTQISHLSLIPTLTQDENDRTELNAIRYAFTVMSNITVYSVTWLVLGLAGSGSSTSVGPADKMKFTEIVLIIVGIGIIFSVSFHLLVKEKSGNPLDCLSRADLRRAQETPMSWICWLKEPQFYQVALLYMATRLFCNLTQAYIPIYLEDTLKLKEQSVAYIPLIIYVSGFVTTTGMKMLNKWIGRKLSYGGGAIIGFAGCLWIWFGDGPLFTQYLLYVPSVFIGMAGSTMLVTSLSITADLIGPNVESGAFVYGAMSFTDKLSNGLAVMLIQSLNPCSDQEPICTGSECCPKCEDYFRGVLAFGCGGAAILGLIAIISLGPTVIGTRRKGAVRPMSGSIISVPADEATDDVDGALLYDDFEDAQPTDERTADDDPLLESGSDSSESFINT